MKSKSTIERIITVGELKKIIENLPDDMGIMQTEEINGCLPVETVEIATLNNIQYTEYNGKPLIYDTWEYPSNYQGKVIGKKEFLVLCYY